jgi:CRP-like cAMP-binding protein
MRAVILHVVQLRRQYFAARQHRTRRHPQPSEGGAPTMRKADVEPLGIRTECPRQVGGFKMERRAFKEGETIFREGDVSDCAYLIVVGSVRVHLPNGIVKVLGPGEIFGEMGLIDSRPRSATVVASQYCVFARYSEAELLTAIKTHPDEAVEFIKALIARLREANEAQRRAKGATIGMDNYFG